MSMKSRRSRTSRSSAESYQRAVGSDAAASDRRAGSESLAATISTSSRRPQAGTWTSRPTFPRPMIAPRSIASAETVLTRDRVQRLVEDGEPGESRLLLNDQWRVDADRRRIRHGHQTAPQAFLVERAGHVLAERLLRAAITNQLD